MKKGLLTPSLVFFTMVSSSAFASTYVKCGKAIDTETLETQGYELELSSESDRYTGHVGGEWNLKLKESGDWLKPNRNVTAKTTKVDGTTIIEVTIKQAQAASGPVGLRYRLVGLWDEEPVLEKYSMGGFVGTRLLEKFKCVGTSD